MKVNDLIMERESLFSRENKAKSDANFEKWLEHPASKADDSYYWKHQHQLQLSDLQFKGLEKGRSSTLIEKEVQPLEKQENETMEKKSTNQMLGLNTKYATVSKNPSPRLLSSSKVLINKTEQKQFCLNLLSQKIDKLKTQIFYLKMRRKFKKKQWKNHHIFIENGELECTVNTENLTEEEVKVLILGIKKLAEENHLHLRILMINGRSGLGPTLQNPNRR